MGDEAYGGLAIVWSNGLMLYALTSLGADALRRNRGTSISRGGRAGSMDFTGLGAGAKLNSNSDPSV